MTPPDLPGRLGHLAPFVPAIVAACRAEFPKACGSCGRVFRSFEDYITGTEPVGAPMPDDIEDEDPLGLLSLANCRCGSSLALTCAGGSAEAHVAFNAALWREVVEGERSSREILTELRDIVRDQGARAG